MFFLHFLPENQQLLDVKAIEGKTAVSYPLDIDALNSDDVSIVYVSTFSRKRKKKTSKT